MNRRKWSMSGSLKVLLCVFWLFAIILPLIRMLSTMATVDVRAVISARKFSKALQQSLKASCTATLISVSLAGVLSWAVARTNVRHKTILNTLITVPMLIPSISHGIGFINLFGTNGLIANLNIFGFKGIVMGSIMYSFPTAFLMFNDAFKYIDNSLYENARVLGLNRWETFRKITFPYMRKSFFPSLFAVFTLIFTDYGVPLTIGGNYITLPVYLYKQVIGLLDFSKGTIIGLFLLIPATISFLMDAFRKDHEVNDNVVNPYVVQPNKVRDVICAIVSYSVIVLMVAILGSFVYLSFVHKFPSDMSLSLDHFGYLARNDLSKYFFNSLIISVATSVLGTTIAYASAVMVTRSNNNLRKLIHILSIVSMSIPGIVLGLSYIIAFRKTPVFNTYVIIVICNIVHFTSSPYLLAYNALNKVNKTYEDLGATYDINTAKITWKVLIPVTRGTILEMFSYIFVNSMMTISAVAFLYNSSTMPLSLLINRYENSLMMEETAIISLLILVVNLLVKSAVYLIKRKDARRKKEHELNL
ncbi:MAG: ABC transporter permease subunit [Erysipelotrichaceae bacterium]|nr:ABC transporter permease subunit [Erysipelotrichaceae bacterium]